MNENKKHSWQILIYYFDQNLFANENLCVRFACVDVFTRIDGWMDGWLAGCEKHSLSRKRGGSVYKQNKHFWEEKLINKLKIPNRKNLRNQNLQNMIDKDVGKDMDEDNRTVKVGN